MRESIYTLGVWRVKPEHEADFITAWKALGALFNQLSAPPTGKGTLIQSLTEPTLFYSFGPWPSLEAVQEMRQNSEAQAGLNRLRELCTEAIPGYFRLVAES
jgi:heme-degrading monooxygenase HmoA